jgi:hypothetical protein
MPLYETFNLSPRQQLYEQESAFAYLYVYGGFFSPFGSYSLNHQYSHNRIHFSPAFAGDSTTDYSISSNLCRVPHIRLQYDLGPLNVGGNKELALVFSFTAESNSNLLICALGNPSPLAKEVLATGDDQFMIGVETLDPFELYFISTRDEQTGLSGSWYFRGISGYIV